MEAIAVEKERAVEGVARRIAETETRARMVVAFSGPQGARSVADEMRRIGLPDYFAVLFAVPRNMVPLPPSLLTAAPRETRRPAAAAPSRGWDGAWRS